MSSGITGATITTLTNGTTANASDVMASLNSLKNNGVNNDSGAITTDNAGNMTVVSVSNGQGIIRGTFNIAPYQLINNVTINVGTTNNYTCTGVGGIPAGATGVHISIVANATNVGNNIKFAPHGGTLGDYLVLGSFQATGGGGSIGATTYLPLDGSGKIDVQSNGTGSNTLTVYIYAYVY